MEVRLLGSLEVRGDDGLPVEVSGGRQRTLLAMLALRPGELVSAERLIDEIGVSGRLSSRVMRCRLRCSSCVARWVLGSSRRGPGYSLAVAPEVVDAVRFDDWCKRDGRRLTAVEPGPRLGVLTRRCACGVAMRLSSSPMCRRRWPPRAASMS